MNNLFNVLISTVKSRLTALVSRFKMYTSMNFIRTKIIAKLRNFFASLMDVRPRSKTDYYPMLGWLVSKRLAFAVVIFTGVLSLGYIVSKNSAFKDIAGTNGIRTYKYNSIQLRFVKGPVRIKARSGYVAYEGNVEKGYTVGRGNLYNKNENLVYSGNFEKNKYEGEGTEYFNNGNVKYVGSFHENLYEGSGKLYRADGSREYEGTFSQGKKNGMGELYNPSGERIFSGNFSNDSLLYSDFLGKATSEVAGGMYNGSYMTYQSDDTFMVHMKDIDGLYVGIRDGDSIEDGYTISDIYVLKDSYSTAGGEVTTIKELKETFGEPVYEGNSKALLPEVVAVNILNKDKKVLGGKIDMETEMPFTEVCTILDYDQDKDVYLYSFEQGDLIYNFVSEGRDKGFAFYYIESSSDSAA